MMDVAALMVRLEVAGVERSSWRRSRKFAVSLGEIVLHSTPSFPGYSQLQKVSGSSKYLIRRNAYSKSMPSNCHLATKSESVFTNMVRFSAVATAVEK